jgi:hypothetical protein
MEDRIDHDWRKSSYSGNGGANCLEVRRGPAGTVAVRDSKNPGGPVLIFTSQAWTRLLTRIQSEPE